MIENEEAIKLELDNTVNDEGCMRDYKMILQLLNQQTSTDHRVSIKAMEELRTIAIRDLGRMIDSMINISCLAERFEIPDQVFNHLSVTLSSYIKEISLSSDSEEDKKLLIRWLNKISYSCFRANSSLQLKKNIAVSFCRLLAHNEFFDDILFSDEVYFRYVKKFLTGTENEAQLNTSIMICESFLNEDTHLIIAALPKFVVDAVESFSNCGSILLETIFTADFQKSLECLDRINRVICSLLVVLVEEFTKYSRQALETLSSFHLCKYLRKVV